MEEGSIEDDPLAAATEDVTRSCFGAFILFFTTSAVLAAILLTS